MIDDYTSHRERSPFGLDQTTPAYTVTQVITECNFSLEADFADLEVEGEVLNFKINQGKWVFFDLKDEESSLNCFMVLSRLGIALSDGMRVRVRATPRLTRWGKFSLTVSAILPLGEGNIKKSFEMLKRKLTAEGLFDPARKRPLPDHLTEIGVISSTAAAGYFDFLKILDNRWSGLTISTINTGVQGLPAIDQIIQALEFFNTQASVEVIALLRGGGSSDDLAIFNDERLVRAIAASRIPVITGIGHEIDTTLADLAADLRASTPSNAAERLTPDKTAALTHLRQLRTRTTKFLLDQISSVQSDYEHLIHDVARELFRRIDAEQQSLREKRQILQSLSPESILQRGYAILRGKPSPGSDLEIITHTQILNAKVTHVTDRPNTH